MILLCLPVVALAQDNDLSAKEVAEYEKRLSRGADLFRQQDYSGAREELQRAYDIYPNPAILFSIAGTHRREGDDESAVAAYRDFLKQCSDVVCRNENAEQVKIAKKTIAEIEGTSDEGDGGQGEEEEEEEGEGEGGVRDSRGSDAGSGLRWAGIGFAVVGVAALGFAGIDQFRARTLEKEIEDELVQNGNTWTAELAAKEDDGKSLQKRARIVAISGGAAAVLGVTLYLYGRSKRREGSVAVAPMAPTDGTGLVFSGAF